LSEQFWEDKLSQLQKNTSSVELFNSQFFKVFDAFWVLKCVHHLKDNFFPDSGLLVNSNMLLEQLNHPRCSNLNELLTVFRKIDKKIGG
jgi:hypothetical protein